MATLSPPPSLQALRQLTVPLPLELFDPAIEDTFIEVASSSTHLALGFEHHICIYSIPAFDLVDTIQPGRLSRDIVEPLLIHERILVIRCHSSNSEDFEPGYSLYIWDLFARKYIRTVKRNGNTGRIFTSISVPGGRKGASPEYLKDPVLIVCSLVYRTTSDIETYVLHQPGAAWQMKPAIMISSTHWVHCLASMGTTAVTGGWDGTVRAWNIIAGTCEMAFIGHSSPIGRVGLDEERIYSTSHDVTVRVWDRNKGDCLHVLGIPIPVERLTRIEMFISSPHLVIASLGYWSTISTWGVISGDLEQRIVKQLECAFGTIQGTLATIESDEDPNIQWFRIRDLRTGRSLTSSSFEPGLLGRKRFFQGRFFMGLAKQDKEYTLKVWDFGVNDSLDAGVGLGNNDTRSSRDDVRYKPEEAGKDYHGRSMDPSPSNSVVEDTLPGGSTMSMWGQRKRDKAKSFFRGLFRRR